MPAHFLQEYLETVVEAHQSHVPQRRNSDMLYCNAELQFKLKGGGKCSLCRSAVRHVVPVAAFHKDGSKTLFDCLCVRCIEGERGQSARLVLQLGEASVEYLPRAKGQDAGSHTRIVFSLVN